MTGWWIKILWKIKEANDQIDQKIYQLFMEQFHLHYLRKNSFLFFIFYQIQSFEEIFLYFFFAWAEERHLYLMKSF